MKTNWCHYFIRILLNVYMFRAHRPIFSRVRTAVHTTIGSVSVPLCSRALCVVKSARTERHRNWANGCVNSCTNSPEDGPVGLKHVEIQQYTNKIVTSVGFHSICSGTRLLHLPPVGLSFGCEVQNFDVKWRLWEGNKPWTMLYVSSSV